MKTSLLATLEEAIYEWIGANCDSKDWPDSYVYDDQAKDMAIAAAAVFDASVKGQIFAKEQ